MRNAQISAIAPTGTIAPLMGAETTGIEPLPSLDAIKTLVGGGTMDLDFPEAMSMARSIMQADVETPNSVLFIDYPEIFASSYGQNALPPTAHIAMMEAVQPSVSGAISKTVGLPAGATVGAVADVLMEAWRKGVKSVAVYVDGSKSEQPIDTGAEIRAIAPVGEQLRVDFDADEQEVTLSDARFRLPATRPAIVHKFSIGEHDFYLTAGFYPADYPTVEKRGQLGEIFLKAGSEGSFSSGMVDSFATMFSLALQSGVPLSKLHEKLANRNFEPHGFVVTDARSDELKQARSPVDYIARWLMTDEAAGTERPITLDRTEAPQVATQTGTPCPKCDQLTLVRVQNCRRCTNCAYDEGCG